MWNKAPGSVFVTIMWWTTWWQVRKGRREIVQSLFEMWAASKWCPAAGVWAQTASTQPTAHILVTPTLTRRFSYYPSLSAAYSNTLRRLKLGGRVSHKGNFEHYCLPVWHMPFVRKLSTNVSEESAVFLSRILSNMKMETESRSENVGTYLPEYKTPHNRWQLSNQEFPL
jgi:hypothetical protein